MNSTIEARGNTITVSAWGGGEITIKGLTDDEVGLVNTAFTSGAQFVTKRAGRVLSISAFEAFPDPVVDEHMAPFWRKPTVDEVKLAGEKQLTLFDLNEFSEHSSTSIYISSLCGYNWTQELYETEAAKLRLWGFEIMRSPRGDDGKYWEIWYLPGAWAAEGELKRYINKSSTTNDKQKLKRILDFLCENVTFGSLDISVQRLCLPVPD